MVGLLGQSCASRPPGDLILNPGAGLPPSARDGADTQGPWRPRLLAAVSREKEEAAELGGAPGAETGRRVF